MLNIPTIVALIQSIPSISPDDVNKITGIETRQSMPVVSNIIPNIAQPDLPFRSFTGCCVLRMNCTPQFVQNFDVGGISAPQFGHDIVNGIPQPMQNL